ncbi:hypothetical protein EAS68_05375 [Legionella jordanis]|nr:hypothetical protein EAS68_05375 [Legionella jordanis]
MSNYDIISTVSYQKMYAMNKLRKLLRAYAKAAGKFESNEDNNQAIELYYLLSQVETMLSAIKYAVDHDREKIKRFDEYFWHYIENLKTVMLNPVRGPRSYYLVSQSLAAMDDAIQELRGRIEFKKEQLTGNQEAEKLKLLQLQEERLENFEKHFQEIKQLTEKNLDEFNRAHPKQDETLKIKKESTFGESSDGIGRDPYNLRTFQEQNEGSRLELLKELAPHLLKAGADNIPHIFHTIWLGSEWPALGVRETTLLNEEKGAYTVNPLEDNVTSVKRSNPDAVHLFWTDREVIPDSMQRWCDDRGIKLVQIQSIFPLKGDDLEKKLYSFYVNEKARQSYAAAADILRLMILRSIPGIYLDIDIRVDKELQEIEAKYGIRLNIGKVKYGYDSSLTKEGSCNNDIIMANEQAKGTLEGFCRTLIENYEKTYEEIFAQPTRVDNKIIDYKKQFKTVDYYYLFKLTPMLTTGPGIVSEYYYRTRDHRAFEDHSVNGSPFFMENVQTWIRRKEYGDNTLMFRFDSRESAIEHIVTYILHDLKREPRVLRLENYRSALEEFGIGDEVVQILFTHAKEELRGIEAITGLEKYCTDLNTLNVILEAKGQLKNFDFGPLRALVSSKYEANLKQILNLLDSHDYELRGGGVKIGNKSYSHSAYEIRNIVAKVLDQGSISPKKYSDVVCDIEFILFNKDKATKGSHFFGWGARAASTVKLYNEIRELFYRPVQEDKGFDHGSAAAVSLK